MSSRNLQVALLLGLVAMLPACGGGFSTPTKEVKVNAEGPAMLTREQRVASGLAAGSQSPTAVVPAAFNQPLDDEPPIKPYDQWTEQEAAAAALGRIGTAAIPDLIAALQSSDAQVRLKGVEVLGRMGPDAEPALPQLIKLLDDPELAVRKAAARTIGLIGPAAKDAVPALMRTLLTPPETAPSP